MPSHPQSPRRAHHPLLTPLAVPTGARSPTSAPATPLHSPLPSPGPDSERRPLLASRAHSLKRRTSHFGDLLFDHAPSPHAPSDTAHGYDGEFRKELDGDGGNGVRGWYDNYHTIDWIHDAIKHSLRMRRLRQLKRTHGLRGQFVNLADASLGWILVSVVGFFTACIAFAITRSEMWLFDLKEGYCIANWRTAKRFCCRNDALGAFAAPALRGGAEHECTSWRTWAQVWQSFGGDATSRLSSCIVYILFALAFSITSALLTLHFTASTSVYSSKDSPSVPHPGFSPGFIESLPSSSSSTPSRLTRQSQYGAVDELDAQTTKDEDVPLVQRPRKTLYYAAGSGIPEIKTILSGFVIRGFLGSWTLAVKSVGLALSVASGLSLGKEGPLVMIACCVGNIASRFVKKYDRNEAKRREVLSAACAAGVAVSFGAPVGGVLFSLEEVSYFFPPQTMLRSFWCAMIAAASLKFLDPFKTGKIVLFAVTYDRDWHALELVGFVALAVFGGVYGALFNKANIWWTREVRNKSFLRSHPVIEVAVVTLFTAGVAFINPWAKMGGTELISTLFSECHKDDRLSGLCISTPAQVWSLVASIGAALVLKAVCTAVTFGIKVPAGIFIPTLCVGACAGRILGLLVELTHAQYPSNPLFDACRPSGGESGPRPFGQACVLPGVWAMIGAAATLAGVTRTTVSLAVIVFELTGTLTYSVPTMLAVLVAKTVADWIEPRSIYDLVIEVADLPYLDAKTEYIHDSTPGDILDADAPTISLAAHNTVGSLRAKLAALYAAGTASGFPLVAPDDGLGAGSGASGQRMYAYLASKELEHGLALARARGLADDARCGFSGAEALARVRVRPAAGDDADGPRGPPGADLGWLTDQAPLTISARSPMELLHEMFVKLGIRYAIVVDERGIYRGVIEKNRYLHYLRWLEKRAHEPPSASAPAAAAAGKRRDEEEDDPPRGRRA
ncbi:hypothetical protein JCM3770_000699 [Rhodotorula araucariae]